MAEYEAASFLSVGWMCIDAYFSVLFCVCGAGFFFFIQTCQLKTKKAG